MGLQGAAETAVVFLINLAGQGEEWLSILAVHSSISHLGYVLVALVVAVIVCIRFPTRLPLVLTAGMVAIAALRIRPLVERPVLQVLLFDIGQGDAALIRTSTGRTLLVDAGPSTDWFDSGDISLLDLFLRDLVSTEPQSR